MSKLTRLIKSHGPGPLTYCHAWLQAKCWPTPQLRREARIRRAMGVGQEVAAGPFRGMKYVRWAADKALLPRLLGAYECELHDAVEDLCRRAPDALVVAGAGEGYYAVGLARRLPEARVYAYDNYRWANYLLRKMAVVNGVAHGVTCGGHCTAQELQARLAPARRPAVVCDVEGEEQTLLDPVLAPALRRAAILVELHDRPDRPIEPVLRNRFRGTHAIAVYDLRPRTLADVPTSLRATPEDALWAIDEERLRGREQRWLYLTPHFGEEPACDLT